MIIGLCLLASGKLSGSEFVTFSVAFAVLSLIVSFASEVQEFSVAGNIVKLREVKKEAEDSIAQLKSARTETFRFLLSLAKRRPGGWGSLDTTDSRVKDFWFLYKQIEKFGCRSELQENISETLQELLKGQINSISHSSNKVTESLLQGGELLHVPTPRELTIVALDDDSIRNAAERGICEGSTAKIKESIAVGLEEYARLYNLNIELQKA